MNNIVYIMIYAAALVILGSFVIYLKMEAERLRRENRQACMRETLMQNQLNAISNERNSIEYREKSRADHQVMVREEKIAALEGKIAAIERKHKAEIENKDIEIRNQAMMINTFKKQIDRLSGMSELNKEAGA